MKNSLLFLIICILLFNLNNSAQTDTKSGSKNKTTIGLTFKEESGDRLSDSSYTEVIQLSELSGKAQAIQFRILFNKSSDDNTILIFEDIQKGADIDDPAWLLDFNIIKGSTQPNGASQDEIFVLIYNSNQDGGLSPGNYTELFKVKYKIASVKNLKKDIKSSMKISNAEASTFNGFPINISPSHDEFKVYLKSK